MLMIESNLYTTKVVTVMSEVAILAATVKTTFLEIAKQAGALGVGLQNAAPGEKSATPNNSVQYLLHTHELLAKLAEECDQLLSHPSQHKTER